MLNTINKHIYHKKFKKKIRKDGCHIVNMPNIVDPRLSLYLLKLPYYIKTPIGKWDQNFRNLVSQWRSGKQEIFVLTENTYSKHYERAFRDLFADTGYQATVGSVKKLGTGNTKSKRLFVTLPDCFGH